MWETWVRSLGWEDPLEKGRLPTPVFWPGEFHGLYNPWGCKESDTTERLLLHFTFRGYHCDSACQNADLFQVWDQVGAFSEQLCSFRLRACIGLYLVPLFWV